MVDDDDIIRGANRFFKSVGSVVKKAGATVAKAGQQVVSGRGTIAVALERDRFKPGDEVRGKVTLTLAEPCDGKRLVVRLRASQRAVDVHRTGGVRTVGTSKVTIYEFDKELAGARRFASEELPFTLAIPRDATSRQAPAPAGRLGDVARAVSSVVAPTTGPIEWRVTATLVIPFGRDLDHGVDIVVD